MRKLLPIFIALTLMVVCVSVFLTCTKRATKDDGEGPGDEFTPELMTFLSDRPGYRWVIHTMQSDGTDVKDLEGAWVMAIPGRLLLLSPDKSLIVFSQGDKSQGWLMKINSDGSDLDTLLGGSGLSYPRLGDWSADGAKLTYHLSTYLEPENQVGVYVLNRDGSGKFRLDRGHSPRFCGNDEVVYAGGTGGWEADTIFIIGTDGSGKRQLLQTVPEFGLHKPAGSPDGNRVAYFRTYPVYSPFDRCWLEIVNSDGSRHRELGYVDAVSSIGDVEFSPDSREVLFPVDDEIYVVGVDGSGFRAVTGNSASADGGARWSPDGRQIAFASTVDGNSEIYTVNAHGSPELRRLTDNPASDASPDW
jgi:Tol biopolymer transport system component